MVFSTLTATRLTHTYAAVHMGTRRRLSYFLTIASLVSPYIRGALVYSLVHRGYAAESTRTSACMCSKAVYC